MASDILVQIVDENDNPIGLSSVPDSRARGLITRISRVMVENSKGDKVLLQQRSHDNKLRPGCWDNSAAGHVDAGEDYLIAAKREMLEEIGINADGLEKIGKFYTSFKTDSFKLNQFNTVYKYKYDQTPKKLQKSEVSEVKWFSINDLKNLVSKTPELCTIGLIEVVRRYY